MRNGDSSAVPLSRLCLLPFLRHLFNYKVRKMFAYFSVDTDEAQVMQQISSNPPASNPSPENAANCNEVFYLLLSSVAVAVAKFVVCLPTNLHFLINAAACITNMINGMVRQGEMAVGHSKYYK